MTTPAPETPAPTPLPDHKPDGSGLDDGPWLPGHPRRQPAPKSAEEMAAVRAKAWSTRRAQYGAGGHR